MVVKIIQAARSHLLKYSSCLMLTSNPADVDKFNGFPFMAGICFVRILWGNNINRNIYYVSTHFPQTVITECVLIGLKLCFPSSFTHPNQRIFELAS